MISGNLDDLDLGQQVAATFLKHTGHLQEFILAGKRIFLILDGVRKKPP